MSTAILLSAVIIASATAHSISGPVTTWDVIAPTMNGWTQYNKFDVITDDSFSATKGWVPMNTTGSSESGNLYTPFYNFNGDATKAGWRLDGDESSEVMYVWKDAYSSPNASFTAGNNTGYASLLTMTGLTYLDAPAVASRAIESNGTLVDLPFTTHVVHIGKESTDNGSKKCAKAWNFTATVTTADGTTSFFSAIDNLDVPVPADTASIITLGNHHDPGFSAVVSFSAETPFLSSRGSSSLIGNVTLEQTFFISFCPEDD
ncbi:hypothetical protein B0H17DRAFT_1335490 [Mycena rosella]|uniref:Uncharacterized protein n=1 Tax=Mycena rosella TaxID=1033263 RepID=A0AAD7CZL4_MYCRO|nr:hypothetical protein B0H17DRAFT_1335490 [Mycena rosella]